MQQNNSQSNATELGPFFMGIIQAAPEDQYQPLSAPLFVEEPEQERTAEKSTADIIFETAAVSGIEASAKEAANSKGYHERFYFTEL
jgi:hypothetical protein